MFVSIVKILPLFWVPEMCSMIIGILSFTENRNLDVFQKVECGEGFLSIFFLCLILFALFLLLGALKFLQLL